MPQIPTYTASLTTPPQRTGDELSIASAQAPGAAMAGLGHELQRTGNIIGDIAEQRSREIELRYAADAGQRFTEESIRWQQENGNREDSGEQFKAWSDKRIGELSKEAPNGRAAQAFKYHVQHQANSDWRQNLEKGENVRFNNFKVGESAASQASQEALDFRYKTNPAQAQELRVTDLKNQLARINTAYGTVAPIHAAAMNEAAVNSAVLGATEQSPAFARKLLNDFPLVSIPRREELLAHIKAAEAQQNQGALFDLTQAWTSAYKVAQEQGKPSPDVPPEQLFTSLAGEHGRQIHAQFEQHAATQDIAVGTIGALKSLNAPAAQAELLNAISNLKPEEGAKADGLKAAQAWLEKSWKQQRDDPAAWQDLNQEPITALNHQASEAFDQASKLPENSPERIQATAKAAQIQDQAFTLKKFLQGPAPSTSTPAEQKLFLNRADTHIISRETAEHYADQINQAGPEQRIKLARSLQAQYGAHASDFFADLSTLPSASKELSPALVQGLNIQNERHAAAYMQAQTGQKAENKLDPKAFKEYTAPLDSNPEWQNYMKGWLGEYNQRDKFMASSREGLLNYAVSLGLSGQANNPNDAVALSLKHVVTDQIGMANVNGRVVPMARQTRILGPLQGERARTDDEVHDIGRGLSILLRQLNPEEINQRPFVTAPPGEQGNDFIMRRIWTNGYYVTDHDGQSATLYINGDDGPIQLRDKQNRAFRVVFDDVPAFTTPETRTVSESGRTATIMRRQAPSDFESGYGKQVKTTTTYPPMSSAKWQVEGVDYPTFVPGISKDTTSWNWPTTSKVFTH